MVRETLDSMTAISTIAGHIFGAPVAAAPARPTVIEARRGTTVDVPELVGYRDLLWLLALRDIQVRYKQTALGAAWAVLQPLAMMVVFTFVFGRFMNIAARVDVPYPIFAYAGLLPWTFFAASVNGSSNSLVANAALLRKVYFPRLIMPLAALGAPLVDYTVALVVLGGLMAYFHVALTWQLLLLPVLVGSAIIAALAVGLLLSALTVSYRDLRHVTPFLLQVWLFVTPVIYPLPIAPRYAGSVDVAHLAMNLNPMAGTISAFRAAVLGTPIDGSAWCVSLGVSLLILAGALKLFAANERRFADVV